MACFLAPVAEAIVVSIINKRLEKKAQKEDLLNPGEVAGLKADTKEPARTPFTRKLRWLTNMLWGGSLLLLVEHIWHGEIVP